MIKENSEIKNSEYKSFYNVMKLGKSGLFYLLVYLYAAQMLLLTT